MDDQILDRVGAALAPEGTSEVEPTNSEQDKQETAPVEPEATEGIETAGLAQEVETQEVVEESSDEGLEPEAVEEPQRYQVKVDGEDVEITLEEALQGYQRREDYSRKTAEVGEQRKKLEDAVTKAREMWEQRIQDADAALSDAEQALGLDSEEPDWDYLREIDPDAYLMQRDEFQRKQEQRRQLQDQRQILQARYQEYQRTEYAKFVQEESRKLAQIYPEWADQSKRESLQRDVASHLEKAGFSQQEVSSLADSRFMDQAIKAMRYDALMAKNVEVKKKVTKAPKMLKSSPSADRQTADMEALNQKRNLLRRTGTREAAAAIFDDIL